MSVDDDPILGAKTVAEFAALVNEHLGFHLPTSFPSGTTLAEIWALAVSVMKAPSTDVAYRATARVGFDFGPKPAGIFIVDIDHIADTQEHLHKPNISPTKGTTCPQKRSRSVRAPRGRPRH